MPQIIFIYTMTAGLGDYLIMGDVMRKVESLVPDARCLMLHRRSSHIQLWEKDDPGDRFFDIFSPPQMICLIRQLRHARHQGTAVFGLQMAPGSLQGFFCHTMLKKMGALDYLVDFNLINADIVTPARGNYLLDIQLNQISTLTGVEIPGHFYELNLPIPSMQQPVTVVREDRVVQIGLHPWSRRGKWPCFVWSQEKWFSLIAFLLNETKEKVVVFGRDAEFDVFCKMAAERFSHDPRLCFEPSRSVADLAAAIKQLDLIVSVNTSVVHIAHAYKKPMVILNGPALNFWVPKGVHVHTVSDKKASFPGVDRYIPDERFPSIDRIEVEDVVSAVKDALNG